MALDELLAQHSPEMFAFHGLVFSDEEQQQRLGQFSKSEAVIPFIRTAEDTLLMDLRFAGFVKSNELI